MSKVKDLVLMITTVTSLVSCGTCKDPNLEFGKFGSYRVFTTDGGIFREVGISTTTSGNSPFYELSAIDKNNDGRFDRIDFFDLPKGHPLEAYANLDSLELIYKTVRVK